MNNILARSFLYVPATRPDRFSKAVASGAHAVIVDLEDAVAPANKPQARNALAQEASALRAACDAAGCELLVRPNARDTEWYAEDIQLCASLPLHGLVVPKPDDAAALSALGQSVGRDKLLYLLVETVNGFHHLSEIAAVPGVHRLMLGAVDLMLDYGTTDDGEPLHYFRTLLCMHSRLAGLPPPVDGVCLALDSPASQDTEIDRAKRFGFGGKLCVHPTQIEGVNRGFLPPAAEREWAHRVLAAASSGGAVKVNGQLVDAPIIEQARRILAAAEAPA